MSKERWRTGLKKGLIISLSVLLMSSFVFSFGTKKVEAAAYKTVQSSNFDIIVSAPINGPEAIIISWSPKSDIGYVDYVNINIRWTDSTGPQTSIRLYLCGNGSIEIPVYFSTMLDIYTVNVTTVNSNGIDQLGEIAEDIDIIRSYLNALNVTLNSINTDGIALKNYDIQLSNVAALSYFAQSGGSIYSAYNNFVSASALFFDYPIMKGYENTNPTTANSLFMYPGKEYIFIVVWNRTSALFNSNNYTFNVMSGYETPVMKRSYQNTLASTCIVNAMVLNATQNQSRFTIDWSSTFVNYLNNYQYIPLYFGPVEMCPDEYLQLLNAGFSQEEQATSYSNELLNTTDDLNTELNNIDTVQNDLTSDFEDNLQSIDTDFDFSTDFGSKFLLSNGWLIEQFNNLTVGNPFGSALTFALLLGLALLLIGRVL